MARAVGVSTRELDSMMRNGQLLSNEVLPKFAKELRRAANEGGAFEAGTNSIIAAQNRLNTALTEAVEAFSGAGGKNGIVNVLNGITEAINELKPTFRFLGWMFTQLMNAIKLFLKPFIGVWNLIGGAADKVGLYDLNMPWGNDAKQKQYTPTASSPSNKTYNLEVNMTANGTDPKEVTERMQNFMQYQFQHFTGGAI